VENGSKFIDGMTDQVAIMRGETTRTHSLAARCSNATVRGFALLSALDGYVSRNVGVILCLGLIIFSGNAIASSRLKPLFMDEMLTWTEAQSPNLSALLSGMIQSPVTVDPPLYPIIAFFALRLPLRADLALRLPSFICYSGMMLSLFVIMRRRASPSVALIACFVPMILPAHDYALQARPYALLLGLCGWAFALWQRAADNRHGRTTPLLLLFLCLTFAVWTHYLLAHFYSSVCR
jgi:hypothetical protein